MIWQNPQLREVPKALTTTCIVETLYNIEGNDLRIVKTLEIVLVVLILTKWVIRRYAPKDKRVYDLLTKISKFKPLLK